MLKFCSGYHIHISQYVLAIMYKHKSWEHLPFKLLTSFLPKFKSGCPEPRGREKERATMGSTWKKERTRRNIFLFLNSLIKEIETNGDPEKESL